MEPQNRGGKLISRDEAASTSLTSGSTKPTSAEGVPPLVFPGREVTEQHDSRRRGSVYRLVTPVHEERELDISIWVCGCLCDSYKPIGQEYL